jgi:limonene-1,2-epoxide hydrolase
LRTRAQKQQSEKVEAQKQSEEKNSHLRKKSAKKTDAMSNLELFLNIDSDDEAHHVPQTFMHCPEYYVRVSGKKHAVALLLNDSVGDIEVQFRSTLKAAMGKELVESRVERVKSPRLLEDWDFILGTDPIA